MRKFNRTSAVVAALTAIVICGCSAKDLKLYVDLSVEPSTVYQGEKVTVHVASPGVDLSETGTKVKIAPNTGIGYSYVVADDGISLDIRVEVSEHCPESNLQITAETEEVIAEGWLSIRKPIDVEDAGVDANSAETL